MGDRVHFGGNQPAAPLDASGHNGFPFELPDWAGGSVTAYPQAFIAVPLLTAAKWYWRVKKWRLQVSASVSGSHDSGSPAWSGTLTANVVMGTRYLSFPTRVTRERDLILQNADTLNVMESASTNGPVTVSADGEMDWSSPPECSVGTNLTAVNGLSLFRDGSNIRYPILCGGNASFSGADTFADGFGFYTNGAAGTGSFTAYVDGLPVTFQYFTSDAGGTDNPTTVTAISAVITPSEYWPYAGRDGLPIYDTATGALLSGRSPTD